MNEWDISHSRKKTKMCNKLCQQNNLNQNIHQNNDKHNNTQPILYLWLKTNPEFIGHNRIKPSSKLNIEPDSICSLCHMSKFTE